MYPYDIHRLRKKMIMNYIGLIILLIYTGFGLFETVKSLVSNNFKNLKELSSAKSGQIKFILYFGIIEAVILGLCSPSYMDYSSSCNKIVLVKFYSYKVCKR